MIAKAQSRSTQRLDHLAIFARQLERELTAALARVAELEAAAQAAQADRKDAQRYRWLRSTYEMETGDNGKSWLFIRPAIKVLSPPVNPQHNEQFDAAIDAALQAGGKRG